MNYIRKNIYCIINNYGTQNLKYNTERTRFETSLIYLNERINGYNIIVNLNTKTSIRKNIKMNIKMEIKMNVEMNIKMNMKIHMGMNIKTNLKRNISMITNK